MRVETEIKFECSQCGQRLSMGVSGAGTELNCPSCRALLLVPPIEEFTQVAPLGAAISKRDGESLMGRVQRPVDSDSTLLREKLADAECKRRQVQQDLAALRIENGSLEKQLKKATEERDHFLSTLGMLQAENRDLQKQKSDLLTANENFRFHFAAQEAELANRAQKVRDLQLRYESSESERSSLHQEIAGLKGETERLTARCETFESVKGELETIKVALAASENAQEFVRLKSRADEAEKKSQAHLRELSEGQTEISRLTTAREKLQRDLKAAQEKCFAAEQRAESLSEEKIKHDNSVLRAVLERQNGELASCYRELRKFRRAQLALRLTYALFAMALLGVAAFALRILPDLSILPAINEIM